MLGLSTRDSLHILHAEIEKILREFENKFNQESYYRKICNAFVKRYQSPLGFFSIATSVLTILALLIYEAYLTSILLALILSLNILIVVRENNLRRTEIYRKTRFILNELSLAEQELCHEWKPENYAHLFLPISPCVSLQWTYRDGVIVNLPFALLVRGDFIVLRPGHMAPGPCTEVGGNKKSFKLHEIYGVAQVCDPPLKPSARMPLPDLVCHLEETPYLNSLRLILENATKRPATIYNQQRFLLVTKYIQQWGFIFALGFTLLAGIIHLNSSSSAHYSWRHYLVEGPVAAVAALLPLMHPLMWIAMNLWGISRLQTFLKTPQMLINKDPDKSFEEDLDTPSYDYEKISLLRRSNVFRNWLQLWRGDSELLPRTANVVQVLGSITALCCVDKKGILSWPNPTAEKVFFLHDADDNVVADMSDSRSTLSTASDEPNDAAEQSKNGIVAEVLDLTHDQHCPFRLEFDDHEWKAHIKSLKPLGLAILLNTCSPLTNEYYGKFCGHVTAVAMLDKDLVPVTNRYDSISESSINSFLHGRCLCELAKQIGFTDHATDHFSLEGQLAIYRHLQPEVVRRDIRFARHMQFTSKVKVPFPHSLSVVMNENPAGYLSLFTQGTADIILDCCDDFWDGKDLRPLSPHDRKRALDFYQRNALTAYCTAFAYRPLRHSIQGALSGGTNHNNSAAGIAYLELPPESKIRMRHVAHCDFQNQCHTKLSHSISTDSLLFSESKEEDINDVDSCFEMQCHQVFIGMVTMQYQAQMDIVKLVEDLDRACIRFVHFSKENELRSRVFSEKMGLESGWNCHISLLSESEEKPGAVTAAAAGGNQSKISHVVTQSPKSVGKNTSNNALTTSAMINISVTNHHSNNTAISDSSHVNELTFINSTHDPEMHSTAIKTLNPDAGLEEAAPVAIAGGSLMLPNSNLDKTLSSSAPGAISNHLLSMDSDDERSKKRISDDMDELVSNASLAGSQESLNHTINKSNHRQSKDSALDENCRSMSIVTESTEQSAPVHFDMSNRAKLPRGIENIRPHLEKVDNVPLQVSLFTDCSAEATSEMLNIMQSYGEIVVCLGSSASNSNADIFLQADCSIAVEPLYPQVCQDISAYSEANLINNKLRVMRKRKGLAATPPSELQAEEELLESGLYGHAARPLPPNNTISPIYLSRLLNSLPCSISVCREDALSLVAIIELSRRFSSGLWNCLQFWACCAGSISLINIISACLCLPPLLTPLMVIYIMCIPVPLISLALAHIDVDPKIMNRATGKKQTEYDSRVFGFVLWCYGCKFVAPIFIMILSYCIFMAHPIDVLDVDGLEHEDHLRIARIFTFLGILMHFVVISACFVHREHSLWQRNPFRNRIWSLSCLFILLVHAVLCYIQVSLNEDVQENVEGLWPGIVFLYTGCFISLLVTEITKYQEIKVNTRYQRRARLDFGTKLGMNSPF